MTDRCDRCIVAGVPCHDCRLRVLERAGKGIEPTGRLRVVESENARLRYALRVILCLFVYSLVPALVSDSAGGGDEG